MHPVERGFIGAEARVVFRYEHGGDAGKAEGRILHVGQVLRETQGLDAVFAERPRADPAQRRGQRELFHPGERGARKGVRRDLLDALRHRELAPSFPQIPDRGFPIRREQQIAANTEMRVSRHPPQSDPFARLQTVYRGRDPQQHVPKRTAPDLLQSIGQGDLPEAAFFKRVRPDDSERRGQGHLSKRGAVAKRVLADRLDPLRDRDRLRLGIPAVDDRFPILDQHSVNDLEMLVSGRQRERRNPAVLIFHLDAEPSVDRRRIDRADVHMPDGRRDLNVKQHIIGKALPAHAERCDRFAVQRSRNDHPLLHAGITRHTDAAVSLDKAERF